MMRIWILGGQLLKILPVRLGYVREIQEGDRQDVVPYGAEVHCNTSESVTISRRQFQSPISKNITPLPKVHLHAGLGPEQNVPEVGNRIHSLTYTCNKRYGVHVMIYSGFRCGTLSVTSLKAELTLESANADMPTQPHLQGPSRYGPDNPKKKHNELECKHRYCTQGYGH